MSYPHYFRVSTMLLGIIWFLPTFYTHINDGSFLITKMLTEIPNSNYYVLSYSLFIYLYSWSLRFRVHVT